MMNPFSFFKRALPSGMIMIFLAGLLLSSCNGCSKHGGCPAYTYKAKRDAANLTAKALKTVSDEG